MTAATQRQAGAGWGFAPPCACFLFLRCVFRRSYPPPFRAGQTRRQKRFLTNGDLPYMIGEIEARPSDRQLRLGKVFIAYHICEANISHGASRISHLRSKYIARPKPFIAFAKQIYRTAQAVYRICEANISRGPSRISHLQSKYITRRKPHRVLSSQSLDCLEAI